MFFSRVYVHLVGSHVDKPQATGGEEERRSGGCKNDSKGFASVDSGSFKSVYISMFDLSLSFSNEEQRFLIAL